MTELIDIITNSFRLKKVVRETISRLRNIGRISFWNVSRFFRFLRFSLFVDFSNFSQFLLKFLKMKLFLIFEGSDWLPLGSELWKGLGHWPSGSNLRKLLFEVLSTGFEHHQIPTFLQKKMLLVRFELRILGTIPKAELKSVIVPNISPNILISSTIIDFWFDSFWTSSFASVNFKFKLSSSPRDFKFSSNSRLKINLVDFYFDIIKWGVSS